MQRLALISGGSRGLGAALAQHYRDAGWQVVTFSRSGRGSHDVEVDLSRPEAAMGVITEAVEGLAASPYSEIVAISNAAMLGPVGPLADKPDGEILANIDTNTAGGVLFMTAVVRAFARHTSRKVLANITSGAAQQAFHGWSLYCAAKAGLERFVECLALEQDAQPEPFIAINISPGVVDTGMQAAIREVDPGDFPDRDRFIDLHASGTLQRPADVAAAIAAIIADHARSGERYEVRDYRDDARS